MKLFYFSFIAGFLFVSASCNSTKDNRKSFDDVTKYNDYIIACINSLDTAYMKTLDVMKGKEYCINQCDSLVAFCDQTIEKLKGIQPYDGDSSFAMQAISYTQYMKNNGKTVVPSFLELTDKYETAKSEEEIEQINKELEASGSKLDENYEIQMSKLETVQKALAKKFNFVIIPG